MNQLKRLMDEFCSEGVEYKRLGECCYLEKGKTPIQKANPGKYPLVVTTEERKSSNTYQFEKPAVCIPLISSRGHGVASLNQVFYQEGRFALGNILCGVTPIDSNELSANFLYHYINYKKDTLIVSLMKGGANVSLTVDDLKRVRVPIPPIKVQCEIINRLDSFIALNNALKAELTARKKQYEYYRDKLFGATESIRFFTLPDISCNCDRQRKPITRGKRESGTYPYYGASGIVDFVAEYIFDGEYLLVSEDGANLLSRSTPIAFSISGKNWVNNHAHVLQFKTKEMRKYVELYLNSIDLSKYISGGAQPKLNQNNLNKIPIPVPLPDKVKEIVTILTKFDTLCNDLTSGLPAEIDARQKQYEYYRDKLLTFKELKEKSD